MTSSVDDLTYILPHATQVVAVEGTSVNCHSDTGVSLEPSIFLWFGHA